MDIPGLEPPLWSRNYGDELDEELDEEKGLPPPPLFMWAAGVKSIVEKKYEGKLKPKTLIVALRERPCCYIRGMLSDNRSSKKLVKLGTLVLADAPLTPQRLPGRDVNDGTIPSCYIYAYEGDANFDTVIVMCQQAVSAEASSQWTSCLFAHFDPQRLIVIDTIQDSAFFNAVRDIAPQPTSWRLQSSVVKNASPPCQLLPIPNMVNGLSADILTYCEVTSKACEVYVALSSPHTSSDTMVAFEPVVAHESVALLPEWLAELPRAKRIAYYVSWDTAASRSESDPSAAVSQELSSSERSRSQPPASMFI